MPRASAADAAATRQRILLTATGMFADDDGVAAVSLDAVARAAGVTRGAVYHHFSDREGLFHAVAEHVQGLVADRVVAGAEAGDDPLRAGCHAFFDAVTEGRTARILLVDAPALLGWATWRRMDDAASGTHLRDALRDAGTPPERVDATAALLSGAMNEAALWLAERPGDMAARDAVHETLDALLDAVVPRV